MNTPHRWADVLRAIADGKAVQYRHQGGRWIDWTSSIDADPTEIGPDYGWQIKPKPDVVRYVNVYSAGSGFGSPHQSDIEAQSQAGYGSCGIVRYVIDGETGKLKSAEVLP